MLEKSFHWDLNSGHKHHIPKQYPPYYEHIDKIDMLVRSTNTHQKRKKKRKKEKKKKQQVPGFELRPTDCESRDLTTRLHNTG